MLSPTDPRQELFRRVDAALFRQRAMDFAGRLAGILLVFCAGAWFATLVDLLLGSDPEKFERLALISWTMVACLTLASIVRTKNDTRRNRLRAARRLESLSAEPAHDLLTTAISLDDQQVAHFGFAPGLVRELRVEARQRFGQASLKGVADSQSLFRRLLQVGLILLAFVPFFISPVGRESVWRCVRAFSFDTLGPRPGILHVTPGNAVVVYGRSFSIRVQGSRMPAMRLEVQQDGRLERHEMKATREGFDLKLEGVVRNFQYRVRTLREISPWFQVRILRYPYLADWHLEYSFPPHTGLPPVVDEDRRLISGVRGTRVKLRLRASKQLASADFIIGSDSVALTLQDGILARGELILDHSSPFQIRLLDREGLTGTEDGGRIEVLPDEPPQVTILRPPAVLEWTSREPVPVTWRIEDDFGIGGARFHVADSAGTRSIELLSGMEPSRTADGVTDLQIPAEVVAQGGTLHYAVEAWDNDGVDGAKSAWSGWNVIVIPPPEDSLQAFEEFLDTTEARLRRLKDEEEQLLVEERKLLKQIEKAAVPDVAERKDAEFVVYRQQKIMEEAREINRELTERMEAVKNNPYIRSGMLEKFRRMQTLLQELATPEMAELMNQLQQDMEGMKFNPQDFKKFAQSMDPAKLAEKFDRMVELLERMKDEQQLEAIARRLEELERRQRALRDEVDRLQKMDGISEEGRQAAMEQFSRQQDDLAADVLDITARLEELRQKMENYAPQSGEGMKQAETQLNEALGKQSEAARGLREKRAGEASDKAQQAAEGLKKARESLQDASRKLARERAEKQADEMRRAAQLTYRALEALPVVALRINQSRLLGREAMKNLRDQHLRNTASLVSRMSRNLTTVREIIRQASRTSFSIGPELMIPVDELHLQLRQAENGLTEQREEIVARQLPALTAGMTRLVAVMLGMAEQAERDGNMSLMQQYMEQLQKMAERQQALNQAMQQMGMDGAMSEQMLQQMAMEQQMLQQGMESLAQQFDGRSGMHQRLMELRDEMEDLQAEYLRRNVDDRIKERQERLHQRMLETVKAMKQEGEEEERKAEQARSWVPQPRKVILETERERRARGALRSMESEVYPLEYEELIRRYFERIRK